MKKILFAAVAATTLLSFAMIEPLAIGADMPKADVKMKDISGREISLKEAVKKNGLLVMFTCNTCPYVIKNQDRTKQISAYAKQNNVGVILLNSNEGARSGGDSYEAMKEYARAQEYGFHYVLDKNNELADAFGANRTPETFLFDKAGKLVYHGAIDDNPNDAGAVSRQHLKEAITELAGSKEVSVKTSRSVGCGIKRI